MLHGLDVSHWQGQIDWKAVRRAGNTFAVIEATDGLGYTDPAFARNWRAARSVGLARIVYHFLEPEDGASQAEKLHSLFGSAHGPQFRRGDAVALDLERQGDTVAQAEAFVKLAQALFPTAPILLYTGPYFWQELGAPASPVLGKCPLWLAWWPRNDNSFPELGRDIFTLPQPHNLPPASFWQWTGNGRLPGIAGAVDRDVFLGTAAQLRKLGIHHAP